MNPKEFIERTAKLKSDIVSSLYDLVEEFENGTGIPIWDIDIRTLSVYASNRQRKGRMGFSIEVELNTTPQESEGWKNYII